MDFEAVSRQALDWFTSNGLRLLLIIIATLIALKIANLLTNRLSSLLIKSRFEGEKQKRVETLSSLIRYILRISIILVAFITILGEFGIDIGPILAAAGVVGLAVGFGAQQLVQDIISGFFIILEDQIRVGDVIQVAGIGGLVEKVNLRMVTLRDLSGSVHYVRNSQINLVTNMTKDFSYYLFDIGIAYRENVDEVTAVIREVGESLQHDDNFKDNILEPIEILGLDQFADSAIIIKARFKTKPIKQWVVGREFNRRLKNRFDELNIEIPFPHMTVYMGEDKKGLAPSLPVTLRQKESI